MFKTFDARLSWVRRQLIVAIAIMACTILPEQGFAQTGQAAHRSLASKTILAYARAAEYKVEFISLKTSRRARGLNRRLRRLLLKIERHYGKPVLISSGCRSKARNRKAGGARRSYHLRCMAADIKVPGVSKRRLLRYVRGLGGRGGIGTYCRNSIVHVDVGPRREWHQRCRRRKRG